jgi:hypothetical protein
MINVATLSFTHPPQATVGRTLSRTVRRSLSTGRRHWADHPLAEVSQAIPLDRLLDGFAPRHYSRCQFVVRAHLLRIRMQTKHNLEEVDSLPSRNRGLWEYWPTSSLAIQTDGSLRKFLSTGGGRAGQGLKIITPLHNASLDPWTARMAGLTLPPPPFALTTLTSGELAMHRRSTVEWSCDSRLIGIRQTLLKWL